MTFQIPFSFLAKPVRTTPGRKQLAVSSGARLASLRVNRMLHSFEVPYRVASRTSSIAGRRGPGRPDRCAPDAAVTTRPPARRSRSRFVSRNGCEMVEREGLLQLAGSCRREQCHRVVGQGRRRAPRRHGSRRPAPGRSTSAIGRTRARGPVPRDRLSWLLQLPPDPLRIASDEDGTSASRRASSIAAARPMPR